MKLYRGTIAYDEPYRAPRADAGSGNWSSGNHLEWKREWRDRNREHVRTYQREYMRTYKRPGRS